MNLVRSLTEDREDLEHLSRWSEQLAARLNDAASRLENSGEPMSDELLNTLDAYLLRTRQLAGQLGVNFNGKDESSGSDLCLLTLRQLLEDRERREQILPVIEDILSLRHLESAEFESLIACQREARRLSELVRHPDATQSHAEIDAIARQSHPFNHLLRLCAQENELSDADWIESNDRVTAAFGRQLATAVARGRIQRATAPQPPTAATMPSAAVSTVSPPARALPTHAEQSIVIEPVVAIRPTAVPHNAIPVGLGADSIFEPSPLENSVFDQPTPPPKLPALTWPVSADSPVEQPSRDTPPPTMFDNRSRLNLRGTDETETRLTTLQRYDLVTQLIAADRLPLAMHLARCAEIRPGQSVPFPPVWLLRSLSLGAYLSDPKGELARLMDDDLNNFRPELLTEGDAENQVASSYLLRAAALPAALLTGSATANAILRAIKIAPGCSQLYNYCSRIARYGDRLDGQIVEMFRPQTTDTTELAPESLAEAASRWLEEAARKPVTYGRTSLLFLHAHWTLTASTSIQHAEATQTWCRWQETLQVASRLLRPVIGNLDGERHWVRQEIARLATHMRTEAATNSARQRVGGVSQPTEDMHAVLRQAIELANRWLRLSGATSSGGGTLSTPDALELRDEVLARTSGVLAELNEQWNLQSAPIIRAGIACCRRSVERIHALFAGSRSLPLKESDSRHALHAELLKIPDLELNDQWLPEVDPNTLERALIEHVKQGDTSWRAAYEMHSLHGDHVSTERLLELNVWSNETERAELQALRLTQLAEQRQSLTRELTEAARDLEAVERLGQLEGNDGEVFAQRLDRLRRDLPGLLNFGSCRWQLDQIRSALQRRRQRFASSGGLTQLGWNAASPRSNQSGVATDAANEPADLVFTHTAATRVTDIFSEE